MKIIILNIYVITLLLFLNDCSATKRFSENNSTLYSSNAGSENERPLETTNGTASYYGKKFHGRKTASGEIFNMYGLSASHKTYPIGTSIRVTNKKNGKSVVLKVNDRMPLRNKRLIDISYGAAKELDMLKTGVAKVKVEVLEWGKEK